MGSSSVDTPRPLTVSPRPRVRSGPLGPLRRAGSDPVAHLVGGEWAIRVIPQLSIGFADHLGCISVKWTTPATEDDRESNQPRKAVVCGQAHLEAPHDPRVAGSILAVPAGRDTLAGTIPGLRLAPAAWIA